MPFKDIIARFGRKTGGSGKTFARTEIEELFSAAARGETASLAAALAEGLDPNAVVSGNPLLHVPICNEHAPLDARMELIRLLLDSGANVEQTDANGWTALLAACDRPYECIIELLLERGANAAATDNKGWSAVHYLTVRQGDMALFERIVAAGANVDQQSAMDGNTALMIAVDQQDGRRVVSLLSVGANPSIARKDGLTAMHMVANKGDLEITRALLEAGANPNAKGGPMDCVPLHMAAGAGFGEIVETLLEQGATLSITDRNGHTPLDVANGTGHFEIAAKMRAFSS